jgi:hypothetical protein
VNLEGVVTIHAPPHIVWEIINTPDLMQVCMPGCKSLRERSADVYLAVLEVKVATLRGSFDAELRLSNKVPGEGYRLDVTASGLTGEMHGSGTVTLSPQGLGTVLSYAGEMQVNGMLATIGQRFLASIVEQLTAEFFWGLGKLAEQRQSLARLDADGS